MFILPIIAALLPVFILTSYTWSFDLNPEPKGKLVRSFIYGAIICVPIIVIEINTENMIFGSHDQPSTFSAGVVKAFFVAALPEEGFKLLALWLVLRKNPYFDEHFDGIVYAVFVGMGFAAVENVLYLLASADDWFGVAIARALLSVPGHYADAVFMGYFYSIYKFVYPSKRNMIMILLAPVLVHGTFDTIAFFGEMELLPSAVCTVALIVFCIWMFKYTRTKLIEQLDRDEKYEV